MINSLFMESFISDLKNTMLSITKILKMYGINFCFIGGAARNQYNYNKTTEDVDILVDEKDKDKIKNIPIGFMNDKSNGRLKVFDFHDPKTKLEIIYSGEISGDGINGIKYVEPDKISIMKDNIPIINLKKLIEYKLSAGIYAKGRLKDFADVQELIKANNLKKNFANDFRDDVKNKYIEIWNNLYL